MRNCTCKQCGRIFSENDADPAIHYSNPSTTCPTCETYNKKAIGDWYQTRDGEYKQKLPDVNLLAAAPELLEALEKTRNARLDCYTMTDTMTDILAIIGQRLSSHASDKIIETLLARDSLWRQACEDLRDALKYSNGGMLSESDAHFELYLEKIKKLDDLPLWGLSSIIRPEGKSSFTHPTDE